MNSSHDDLDRRLADLIAATPQPSTPSNLEARVRKVVQQRQRIQRYALGTAAAAIIGVIGLALWQPPHRSGPVVVQSTRPAEAVAVQELTVIVAAPPVVKAVPTEDAWLLALTQEASGGRQ